MAEEREDDDFVYPMTSTTTTTTTTTTTAQQRPPFEPCEHVVLPCNAAGGIFPYEHHAIVVSVGQEIGGTWTMCVIDFTIDEYYDDDDDDGGGGAMMMMMGSASSVIASSAARGGRSATSFRGSGSVDVSSLLPAKKKSSAKDDDEKENDDDDGGTTRSTRRGGGLRLLTVDAEGWRSIEYAEKDAHVDHPIVVRKRVEFLLKNPNVLPSYSLVECNCECVAVWCKTGRWTTLQFTKMAGSANILSRIAITGLSVASWSMRIVIPGSAFLLAAGVVAEVVTGVWGDRARKAWEMRTTMLNDEFDRTMITTTTNTTMTNTTIDATDGRSVGG